MGTTVTTTTVNDLTGCGSPQWATDQWCDDENNNPDCNYDGGACCFNNFAGWDQYCEDCDCIECQPQAWHGDNFCDDELNSENCKYDGGDCCGDVNTTYCTVSTFDFPEIVNLSYFSSNNLNLLVHFRIV